MGIDWSAVAVIGVVLPQARWYRTEEQSHQGQTGHVSGEKAYCPECGQKNERTMVRIPLFEGGEDEDEDPGNGDPHIGRFKLHWSTDDKYGYLGIEVETDSNRTAGGEGLARASLAHFWEMREMRDELAALLAPLGLWESESFGLWAILLCGY
mgnify:CR=1 FL=1